MDSKIDKIAEDITEIKCTLSRQEQILINQEACLKEHMARTKISEGRLDKLEVPYKVIAWLGVPLGIILTILQILRIK